MKKNWLFALTAIAFMVTPFAGGSWAAQATQKGDGIQWKSYEEGIKQSATEDKKVFLVFNAAWCRYCVKMEKETFQDSSVIAYVNRNFIPISVDSDKERAIATKYRVTGLPNLWFLAANGDRIGNFPGYLPAKEMLIFLKYISSDSYRTMSLESFVKKSN